jgi:uncharacterized protein YdcH (DUF465 family)
MQISSIVSIIASCISVISVPFSILSYRHLVYSDKVKQFELNVSSFDRMFNSVDTLDQKFKYFGDLKRYYSDDRKMQTFVRKHEPLEKEYSAEINNMTSYFKKYCEDIVAETESRFSNQSQYFSEFEIVEAVKNLESLIQKLEDNETQVEIGAVLSQVSYLKKKLSDSNEGGWFL